MKNILLLAFSLCCSFSLAQNQSKLPDQPVTVSDCVETMSDFPGGANLFRKLIAENFRMKKVKGSGNETCEITSTVERDGTLSNINAAGSNTTFNEEAVRAVSKIKQKWIPATICNQKVRSRFRVPLNINFN